jgi:hypothetical protein
VELAAERLSRALLELGDMTEVLSELGYVALLADQLEDSEQFLVESLRREPDQVAVRTIYATSLLRQNRIPEARAEYEIAAADGDPAALCGVAFCAYREGDEETAIARFGEARAAAAEEAAAFRAYAEFWQDRIDDHRSKEQWFDGFDREQIKNDWTLVESAGPTFDLEGGVVRIQGTQRATESDLPSELSRFSEGPILVSLEADVLPLPQNAAVFGVRVVLERQRIGPGGQRSEEASAEVRLALFPDRTLRLFVREDFTTVTHDWTTIGKLEAGEGEQGAPVRLAIDRRDYESGTFQVRVGERVLPVGEGTTFVVQGLKKVRSNLRTTVFASAKGRENVAVGVEAVRIVRYKK